jgi:hypothetical protein
MTHLSALSLAQTVTEDRKGSSRDLVRGTTPSFSRRNWGKLCGELQSWYPAFSSRFESETFWIQIRSIPAWANFFSPSSLSLLQFRNYLRNYKSHRQLVVLPGRGISLSQVLYIHREQHEHRINSHRHPCFEWDSNPRSECLSGEYSSCLRPRGHCDRPWANLLI